MLEFSASNSVISRRHFFISFSLSFRGEDSINLSVSCRFPIAFFILSWSILTGAIWAKCLSWSLLEGSERLGTPSPPNIGHRPSLSSVVGEPHQLKFVIQSWSTYVVSEKKREKKKEEIQEKRGRGPWYPSRERGRDYSEIPLSYWFL